MPHFTADLYSPTSCDEHQKKKRKSIFGCVKDKLTRNSSSSSQKTKSSAPPTTMPSSHNPFTQAQPGNAGASVDQPPPAYSVSAPAPPATSFLGPNGGPVRSPSPAPSNAGSISSVSGMSVSTPEDPYAFLSSFDTIFVVDDSGSMSGRSWPEVQGVLRAVTPVCTAHDADGIDLYFLNHKTTASGSAREGKAAGGYYGIKRADTVEGIFTSVRPRGATPTGQRLHSILKPYLQLLDSKKHDVESVKPINIIVITDGAPSDDVESTIITAAKKLDKLDAPLHQIGIQFFQVGNEPGAREALRELDDDLFDRVDGDLRDMVDTATWENGTRGVLTADSILKVVLGAVVRRLDRRRTSGEVHR
ncbi:von willebrand factor [Colletotrichum chrysophilum]|uniref:von willebrand factor n=1 Tax=Colletotrichum chrysophilum TaxID=1836956 RepID=A0AAD9EFQ4_9PEZI|nr:von willebrand factor [Colletotrichum chrysophilum]